jgi:agmatinase
MFFFVRFAMNERLIDPAKSIQVGILHFLRSDDPITVLHRLLVRQRTASPHWRRNERVTAGMPCYLTFDIDCVDPAYAGTGTLVVDGLTPGEIFDTIRTLGNINVVGMDLVEVSPPYDPTEITALFGASVIWSIFANGRRDYRIKGHHDDLCYAPRFTPP